MPKAGYTTLIVSDQVRAQLEAIARAEGFRTVSQFLEALLKVKTKWQYCPHCGKSLSGQKTLPKNKEARE